jgi:hypothetical protein
MHPSAWKGYSANYFAYLREGEVRVASVCYRRSCPQERGLVEVAGVAGVALRGL